MSETKTNKIELIVPVGRRILVRKDEDKKQTKSGIYLPDNISIPTLTGRVLTISDALAVELNFPVKQYDKVIYDPRRAIPVDLELDNRKFVVDAEDVIAVIKNGEGENNVEN